MSKKRSDISLKKKLKKAFLKGFASKNIHHPLFDASKTELKHLLITKRGLKEIKKYDVPLYRVVSRYVTKKRITATEFGKQIERWSGQLRRRTGDTKTVFRPPTKIYHNLSKSGSIGRPLEVIHIDLADVNRLNPNKHRYRYPFILVAVDAYANYTILVPIKNKNANSILNAIKNAFNQFGLNKKPSTADYLNERYAKKAKKGILDDEDNLRAKNWCMVTTKLQTDRGNKFINDTLKAFLKRRWVELFSSRGSGKAYLAESTIGQMKRQLVRIQNILERNASEKKGRPKKSGSKQNFSKKKLYK